MWNLYSDIMKKHFIRWVIPVTDWEPSDSDDGPFIDINLDTDDEFQLSERETYNDLCVILLSMSNEWSFDRKLLQEKIYLEKYCQTKKINDKKSL
jgi:hypothetical protein